MLRYEVHTEAVTQVRFQPNGTGMLLSGSMDELLCEIDTRISDEEDAVTGVHNTESPITSIGFFGEAATSAWVVSSTDVVSTWELAAPETDLARLSLHDTLVGHRAADYLEHENDGGLAATAASGGSGGAEASRLPFLDCLVGCHWDARTARLLLVGGCKSGATHLYELGGGGGDGKSGSGGVGGVRHVHALSGGHTDVVRCFHIGAGCTSILTGGEDAKLCAWGEPQAAASDAAATGEAAAAAGPSKKKEKQGRAKPYDKPSGKAKSS